MAVLVRICPCDLLRNFRLFFLLSALATKSYNLEDLWEQLPGLNKMLRQTEKEKLSSYLSGKVKALVTSF